MADVLNACGAFPEAADVNVVAPDNARVVNAEIITFSAGFDALAFNSRAAAGKAAAGEAAGTTVAEEAQHVTGMMIKWFQQNNRKAKLWMQVLDRTIF